MIGPVAHQINNKMSKSGAAIATLRHANTSDNVMVHQRPISNLEAAEHQMVEEEAHQLVNAAEGLGGAAAVTDLNHAMTSTDQSKCNMGESTL